MMEYGVVRGSPRGLRKEEDAVKGTGNPTTGHPNNVSQKQRHTPRARDKLRVAPSKQRGCYIYVLCSSGGGTWACGTPQ